MSIAASRQSYRGTPHANGVPLPRHVLPPLGAGVLAAAVLLSACSSELTGPAPDFAKGGSAVRLTVTPPSLLLRTPGLPKTFTATVQYSGVLTASSSNPACATVNPTTTRRTEKPAGSSVYVAQFTVTPVGAGGCTITVTDKKGNAVTVRVSVSPIAFFSDRDGNQEIYLMDADGQNQTRLTSNSAREVNPAWSPDGTKIAFISDRDGNHEIYLMDPDGQNQTRLTHNSADEFFPTWSPDGTKIAFMSDRDVGGAEIYVMDADGQNQTRLTNNIAIDAQPDWSPDGTKIAFYSDRNGNEEIYVMDAGGQNQIRLTNNSAVDLNPAWSPDGTKIAFSSERDGIGNLEIYVMDADGQNQARLTNITTSDFDPAWSPDGMKIAFVRRIAGMDAIDVFVMDPDGQNQTRLTNPGPDFHNQEPAWR